MVTLHFDVVHGDNRQTKPRQFEMLQNPHRVAIITMYGYYYTCMYGLLKFNNRMMCARCIRPPHWIRGAKCNINQTSLGMNNTCQQWNYWLNFVVQVDQMHVNSRAPYLLATVAYQPTNEPTNCIQLQPKKSLETPESPPFKWTPHHFRCKAHTPAFYLC